MLKLFFAIGMLATLDVLLPVFGLPTSLAGNPTPSKLEKRLSLNWASPSRDAIQHAAHDLHDGLDTLSAHSGSTPARTASDLDLRFERTRTVFTAPFCLSLVRLYVSR